MPRPSFLKAPSTRTQRSATVLSATVSDARGTTGAAVHLRAFAASGVRPLTAITAFATLTGEHLEYTALPEHVVRAQLRTHLHPERPCPDATLLGLLGGEAPVRVTAELMATQRPPHLVWDPGCVHPHTAMPLLQPATLRAARDYLLPSVDLVIPNIYEAALLIERPVHDPADMKEACRRLHGRGASAILVTGGHLEGHAIDILFDGNGFIEFGHDRIDHPRLEGAGDLHAALIAAELARGGALITAVERAKETTTRAITEAETLEDGRVPVDPMRPLYHPLGIHPEPIALASTDHKDDEDDDLIIVW